jgi:YVTN family beta-propeller protein
VKLIPRTKCSFLLCLGIGSALSISSLTSLRAEESSNNSKSSSPPVNTVIDLISGFNGPFGLAISPNNKQVYVSNFLQSTAGVIDTALNLLVDNDIYAGQTPAQLALTPNGDTLYIADNVDPGQMSILETKSLTLNPPITGLGAGPWGLAVTPDAKQVWIANGEGNTVSVFDIETSTLLTPITVGGGPFDVGFTPNGKTAYVANSDDNTVSVVNVATRKVEGSAITVGSSPLALVVSPDGTQVYVANMNTISVIDVATKKVTSVSMGATVGYRPAFTPDGKYLYVPVWNPTKPNTDPGTIVLISTASDTVVGTPVTVGVQPDNVVISSNGTRAYVTNFVSDTVTVIAISNP